MAVRRLRLINKVRTLLIDLQFGASLAESSRPVSHTAVPQMSRTRTTRPCEGSTGMSGNRTYLWTSVAARGG